MAMPRLKEKYIKEIVPELQKEFSYSNVNQVPTIEKVVVNMGVGEAATDKKLIAGAIKDLTAITGQKPCATCAKKSIAGFHLREGQKIGAKSTIRGDRMWEFIDRLISTALPRVRDFRGLKKKSFDGRGNYSLGVTEQLIFNEIEYEDVDKTRGMDITIVTTANENEPAFKLLKKIGFPFAD